MSEFTRLYPNSDSECPFSFSVDLCPSLSQNDDVGISTDSRSVGTLVQFMCSKEGFELMGPRVLYCMGNRAWNGTTPYCSSVEGNGRIIPGFH